MKKAFYAAAAVVATSLVTNSFAAPTSFNTVSALDPYLGNGSSITTLTDAGSNSATGGVTYATFKTLVANAYTANTGGVVDFETANEVAGGAAANATTGSSSTDAITAKLGASRTTGVDFYRTDGSVTATSALDFNNNNGGYLASGTGTAAGNYFGNQGAANISITFGSGLQDFGLTVVPRSDARQISSTFTIHYADATTLTSSTVSTDTGGTQGTEGFFFGFSASPTGSLIKSIDFANTSTNAGATAFVRTDDLAFIVPSTPEPASLSLLGIGGLGLLKRRRQAV